MRYILKVNIFPNFVVSNTEVPLFFFFSLINVFYFFCSLTLLAIFLHHNFLVFYYFVYPLLLRPLNKFLIYFFSYHLHTSINYDFGHSVELFPLFQSQSTNDPFPLQQTKFVNQMNLPERSSSTFYRPYLKVLFHLKTKFLAIMACL